MVGKLFIPMLLFACADSVWSQVPAEVPALDSVTGGSGTRLVAMPTYVYERSAGSAGFSDENSLWNPSRSEERHLLDRYPRILQWQPRQAGVWASVGNEVGDYLYQELRSTKEENNRTPMIDLGVTSKLNTNYWFTAQGSQVDHFSSADYNRRENVVGTQSFSWFGQNLPAYSTLFTGGGFQDGSTEVNALAGGEYVWVLTPSQRWVPMQILPRIQAQASLGAASLQMSYERQLFSDHALDTNGLRNEVSATLRYGCMGGCKSSSLKLGVGMTLIHASDTGAVPWGLPDQGTVAWPWIEANGKLLPWLTWAGFAGSNDRNHLLRDSLEASTYIGSVAAMIGWLNHWGTTQDPLREDYEKIGADSISLRPAKGYEQLQKIYARVSSEEGPFDWSGSTWLWADHGAETFAVSGWRADDGIPYRVGSMARVNAWLTGLGTSARIGYSYQSRYLLSAEGGWESWRGPAQSMDVEPSHFWTKFSLHCRPIQSLEITHEWVYRSAASWNLRAPTVLDVPGGWTWNASILEHIPFHQIDLQATWLHVFAPNEIQTPSGGLDRTRFYGSLRKNF